MKSLKFDHNLAQAIWNKNKTSTLRIDDDKNLRVDDELVVIDKINPKDHTSWRAIGQAKVNEITEKRIKNLDLESLDEYTSLEDLLKTFQGYYGNDVSENTPVKIIHFSFKSYRDIRVLDKVDDKKTTKLTEVKLYTDGGSRGNPGPSASGYVVLDMQDNIVFEHGVYLGVTTNNQAEYQALKLGLEALRAMSAEDVHVYMDSLLVVNQILGKYKVKNRDLWPIYEDIKQLAKTFKSISFTQIPRELNKLADSMVNKALDDELLK